MFCGLNYLLKTDFETHIFLRIVSRVDMSDFPQKVNLPNARNKKIDKKYASLDSPFSEIMSVPESGWDKFLINI